MATGLSRNLKHRPFPQSASDSHMSRSPYTLETITSPEGVQILQQDWDRVSASSDHPNAFTTFGWYEAWYRHLAAQYATGQFQRNVFAFKHHGEVCGIAPLACFITSTYGMRLRRLQFIGRNHEWDYNDLVVGDDLDGKLASLAKHLSLTRGNWELVDLMDLRDTDDAPARIQNAVKHAGLSCVLLPSEGRCPYMPISGSWEEMLNERSSSSRQRFRKRLSRLNREGDSLRVRIVENPHQEPRLLDRMIALEAQKQVGGEQSRPFIGLHRDAFASIFERLGPGGWIRVALMELDERLLAYQLLFRCGKAIWGYLMAYDRDYARFSPGSLLVPAVIDYGFAQGLTEFDFLSGEEPYKMHWATSFHQRARILIWNDRWKSQLYAALYRRRHASVIERSGAQV